MKHLLQRLFITPILIIAGNVSFGREIINLSQSVSSSSVDFYSTTSSFDFDNYFNDEFSLDHSVAASPREITGRTSFCVGESSSFSDVATGGYWKTSNSSVATIDSATGMLSAISVGSDSVYYIVGVDTTYLPINVNTVPDVPSIIVGPYVACSGSLVTFSNTTTGGSWSSTNTSVANISSGGATACTSEGTAVIKYTVSNSCGSSFASKYLSVRSTVTESPIMGASELCVGSNVTMTDSLGAGVWTSEDPSIATVSSGGIVTSVSEGSTNIKYSFAGSCGSFNTRKRISNVLTPRVESIIGASDVCTGTATSYSNSSIGGVWSLTDSTLGSIDASGNFNVSASGAETIVYTVENACGVSFTTYPVTINSLPTLSTITSDFTTWCEASAGYFYNDFTTGTWSTSDASVLDIYSDGFAYSNLTGTATITYSASNSCGDTATSIDVTVNPMPVYPAPIDGAPAVCVGATTTLIDTSIGGTWSSSDISVADVAADGTVTGFSGGSVVISYTNSNVCGDAPSVYVFTVNSIPEVPVSISGPNSMCLGFTSTYTDSTLGGTWSSSDVSILDITPDGVATSFSEGLASVYYTVSNDCGSNFTEYAVAVNSLPAAPLPILGVDSACTGSAVTFTNDVPGGFWTSSDTTIATVDVAGNIVGLTNGEVAISYTISNDCGSNSVSKNLYIQSVPVAPASITGSRTVCSGTFSMFYDVTPSGVWSSSDATIINVNAVGMASAISTGTASISYTVSNSCGSTSAVYAVEASSLPFVAPVDGSTSVCTGSTIHFTDAVAGGTWTIDRSDIATVDSNGYVTGVTVGTNNVTYTLTNACGTSTSTASFSVNSVPSIDAIVGSGSVCVGTTSIYNNTTIDGIWSVSNPAIATIESNGTLHAVSGGSVSVSYSKTNACGTGVASTSVNINSVPTAPAAITGASTVCNGTTTNYTNTTTGGSWSSSDTGIISIATSGSATTITAGSATITYTVSNACGNSNVTKNVSVITVPASPSVISGTTTTCVGTTNMFTNSTSGGSWSSSNPVVLNINSATGLATSSTRGTANVVYTVSNSCGSSSSDLSVNIIGTPEAPSLISGSNSVCIGSSLALSDSTSGGIWSSSDFGIASVSGAGLVYGVSAGVATITYSVTNSCGSAYATKSITVNSVPASGVITGANTLCVGNNSTYTSSVSGGTWSVSDATLASINSVGTLNAIATGNVTVSYTISTSCGSVSATRSVSINSVPAIAPITGAASLCQDANTLFTSATTSGNWVSSNSLVASVSIVGEVYGVSAGMATITYNKTNSCGTSYVVKPILINALPAVPASISGTDAVCSGSLATYSNAVIGGMWQISDSTIASIDAFGNVTTSAPGAATISYSISNLCGTNTTTKDLTVLSLPEVPTAIDGISNICLGSSAPFNDAVAGGVWSSSDVTIANVLTDGTTTGLSTGTATITYSISNTCGENIATFDVSINPLPDMPSPIAGETSVCQHNSSTLYNDLTTGVWSSSDYSIASVTPEGVVTGLEVGGAEITYTISNDCGSNAVSVPVSINPLPSIPTAIVGNNYVCHGASISLSDSVAGGVWTSSNTSVATVGTDGIVYGANPGSATITYTIENSCGSNGVSKSIDVRSLPSMPTAISGDSTLCYGTSTTYTNSVGGGVWTSANSAIASVNTLGVVTGNTVGSTTIAYTISNTCGTNTVNKSIRIKALPAVPATIFGATSVCTSASTSLTNAVNGGVWTSQDPLIASVSSTGSVRGNSGGSTTISYTIANTCGSNTATKTINSIAAPVVASVSGPASICKTTTGTFMDSTTGGSWSIMPTTAGTISAAGVFTPSVATTVTVKYTVTNSCFTTVASSSLNVVAPLTSLSAFGDLNVCVGSNTTPFTASVSGGRWTSTATAFATIDATTGVARGISAGTTTISYTLTNVCNTYYASRNLSVSAGAPNAGILSGPSTFAVGTRVTITETAGSAAGVWTSSNSAIASIGIVLPASNTLAPVTGISSGTATITYTVSNSCGSNRVTKNVTVTSAREEIVAENIEYNLFPNPAQQVIYISAPLNAQSFEVSIYDMSGKIVKLIPGYTSNESIDISGLSQGAYIVNIKDAGSVQTKKLIVQ